MTTAAIGAINLYQQFLSPYKGFRCAHRVKHGRMSCSQFAKRLIEKVGLFRFAPILMRRLRSCGQAARALRASDHLVDKGEKDHAKRRQSSCDGCDGAVPDFGGCDTPGTPDGCAGLEGASACDGAGGCDGAGCDFSI